MAMKTYIKHDIMKITIRSSMKSFVILLFIFMSTIYLSVSQQKTDINYDNVTDLLINENADEKTQELYDYLKANYGQNIISGQTSYWEQLIEITGKEPMLRAFDFQSYTQGYPYVWEGDGHTFGWHDNGSTQQAINWYKSTNRQGIVTFQWHWHSPFGGNPGTNTFYSWLTSFSVINAITSGTAENTAILQDIDSIATQLKKLQHAGVPVLWRPLHEASGHGAIDGSNAWFWWGSDGAVACLELYDIIYERLTDYHQLNNLIWVWSSPEDHWYPENEKVDILGYDSYPGDFNYAPNKQMFDQLYNVVGGEKIIAMSENGPIPDIDQCINQDAMWSYFSSWSNLVAEQNSPEHIQAVYNHPNVLTLSLNDLITVLQPIPQFSNPFHPDSDVTFEVISLKEIFTLSDDASESSELSFVLENNSNPNLAQAFIQNDTILMLEVFAGQKGSGSLDVWASADGSRSVPATFEFNIFNPEEKDHLLYQQTTSSSNESNNHLPEFAVDGRSDTRWSSQYSDQEWISVEMEESGTLERVMLHWEAAYGKHYKIEVSDNGTDWIEIFEETCSNGGFDRILFEPMETKHVRMYGVTRGTQFGFSLWSFEAYSFTDENQPPVFNDTMTDQYVITTESLTVNLPDNIVSDPNQGDRLYFDILQSDGNPLPGWITFDDCALQLRVNPLAEHAGEYDLIILVTDTQGEQAESNTFKLVVEPFVYINEIIVTGEDGANEINTPGGKIRMYAQILPENATSPGFTWSTNDPELATINSVGILTAKTNGVVTVSANATDGSGVVGQMEVILTNQDVSNQPELVEKDPSQVFYPNPADKEILFAEGIYPEIITIHNLKGQKVLFQTLLPEKKKIDILHLDPGFYVVTILTRNGKTFNKKLLKY